MMGEASSRPPGWRRFLSRLAGSLRRPASRAQLETPHVATGRVLAVLAGWAAFVAVAVAGFGWYTLNRVKLGSPAQDVAVLPAPRLQVDPAADYDRLTALQNDRLASYAWVDRSKGTVRIPVERAMAILAAKGTAALAPLAPAASPGDARAKAVDAATRAGAEAAR